MLESGMAVHLNLSADEVLSTTRAVRKRLDLTRPVEREVLEECLRLAQQAPSGSNSQGWHFLVGPHPPVREKLAELWRRGADRYWEAMGPGPFAPGQERIIATVRHLADHIH